MRALIIDTSTHQGLLGISFEGRLLRSQTVPSGPSLSKTILQTITSLLQEEPLDYIAVGIGPGSYTGTRVGVTVAKSLSYALDLPLVGFCSLMTYLAEEDSAAILCAKNGDAHVLTQTTGHQRTPLTELSLLTCPIRTPDFEGLKKILPSHSLLEPALDLQTAAAYSFTQFQDGSTTTDGSLSLIYLHHIP